MNSKRSSFW